MGKKNTKRSKQKYPSLTKKYNSRVRQEYLDYDYIDQLSDEEKKWLEDFNSEYYMANVGRQADEGKNNRFTKGRDAVKASQSANNARNADLYGKVRNKVGATKLLNYDYSLNVVEEEYSREVNPENLENALIDYLDYTNNLSNTSDDGNENS
jgi:hypothetical protein